MVANPLIGFQKFSLTKGMRGTSVALPSAARVLLGWSQKLEYPWDSLGSPIKAAFTHSSQRFFRQGGYSPQGRTALGGCHSRPRWPHLHPFSK